VAISKANFNSFNVTPTASKFITFNSSNNGLAAGDVGGSLVLISTTTISDASTVSITSGLDSTYKEYIFKFYNIHPNVDADLFVFNFSVDGGSNYNVSKNTTMFGAAHAANGASNVFQYFDGLDLNNGTGLQYLSDNISGDNEDSLSGELHLFEPSNTTFVKHFCASVNYVRNDDRQENYYLSGYANTTSAIDAIQFSMTSGGGSGTHNVQSGVIKLYGVS